MSSFALFALFLCFGSLCMVVVPLIMHPTFPKRRKLLWSFLFFLILVPLTIVVYMWVGAPPMAV